MTVEVCLSPKLYFDKLTTGRFVTVITDIFRATTSVVAALDYGVASIIPVENLDEAHVLKEQGFVVAAEREGKKIDFADIGNSATEFFKPELIGETIVYSTTNGVKAIQMAADAEAIALGAFMNLSAVAKWVMEQQLPVLIFCAGWKNKVNLEDTLFAGALTELLINDHGFTTDSDAAHLAYDVWQCAKDNILEYIEKASHRHRLAHLIDHEMLKYTFTPDSSKIVPVYKEGKLVAVPELI